MGASTLLLLQIVNQAISNQAQTSQRKRTESTGSYEHSTSCCGNITAPQDITYCNIIIPQETTYCNVTAPQGLYCHVYCTCIERNMSD